MFHVSQQIVRPAIKRNYDTQQETIINESVQF